MRRDWQPTAGQVSLSPELALLVVVDHALEAAVTMLKAANPEIDEDSPVYCADLWHPTEDWTDVRLANDVVYFAEGLHLALYEYYRHLASFWDTPGPEHSAAAEPAEPTSPASLASA